MLLTITLVVQTCVFHMWCHSGMSPERPIDDPLVLDVRQRLAPTRF
jgi:hypothetical protein